MDDSTDSDKDLFITQSTFRTDANTQDAEEAANFFLDDFYDPSEPEVVKYLDFSNDESKGYTIMTESQSQEVRKRKAQTETVSLEGSEENSDKVYIRFSVTYCISHFAKFFLPKHVSINVIFFRYSILSS